MYPSGSLNWNVRPNGPGIGSERISNSSRFQLSVKLGRVVAEKPESYPMAEFWNSRKVDLRFANGKGYGHSLEQSCVWRALRSKLQAYFF